jgi:hypothetical protein
MYRYSFIIIFLYFFITGCQSSQETEYEPVYSPVGIVIMTGDSIIIQYRGGEEIIGELSAKSGNFSPKYSLRFIDVSGSYFTPSEDNYSLTIRVENPEMADVWIEGFDFYIKGKMPGRTNVILKIFAASVTFYTSKPVPTIITE